ncbi:MAG: nitrogen regulation protein NR(II) [Pseudomonadales bacterium]|nr:nitrogen regulation protein NR(II) [Pseudomonadales bacterium]
MNNAEIYQLILEDLSTSVLLLDSDLQLQYINPAAENLLDVSANRVMGTAVSSFFHETEESIQSLRNAVAFNNPFSKRRTKITLSNDKAITVDYTVTPIMSSSGTALLMEIQPLDRLLRIAKEEASVFSNQANKTLIRGLAHEIKNPLGGIRGAAQLLARQLPEEEKEYTQIIIEEADRLRNLVDRMLGPNNLPNMVPASIHEVLERVRVLVEVESSNPIEFIRDYDPSIPDITADRELLIQAILNIVRNAMESLARSDDPSLHPEITLRTRTLRQFTIGTIRHRLVCLIEVIDNGPGINEKLIDSIFFPMISGRANGSGLGLPLSQSILNQHQGSIECDSRPGHTRFSIHLPIQ